MRLQSRETKESQMGRREIRTLLTNNTVRGSPFHGGLGEAAEKPCLHGGEVSVVVVGEEFRHGQRGIEYDTDQNQRHVNEERHPPTDTLPASQLQVPQHVDADEQASDCACQVGHVASLYQERT